MSATLGSYSIYFTTNMLEHKPMNIKAMTNQKGFHCKKLAEYQGAIVLPGKSTYLHPNSISDSISTYNFHFSKEEITKNRKHQPPGGKGLFSTGSS